MWCDCGWDFQAMAQGSFLEKEAMMLSNLASLSDRLAGQILDSIVALAAIIAGVVYASFSDALSTAVVLGGVGFAIFYVIFADGFAGGQSYGKRIMKTAVIDKLSGKPCTYKQSFIRNILLSILGIFDWIFIFGKKRQRLGDMAANTIVVKKRDK